MSINDAFFVSDKIHERPVKLQDGSEHILFFKELPSVIFRAFQLNQQSKDEGVQVGSIAKLISQSLCEPDGKPALPYERALKLTQAAANAILDAILAVNGYGAEPKKD